VLRRVSAVATHCVCRRRHGPQHFSVGSPAGDDRRDQRGRASECQAERGVRGVLVAEGEGLGRHKRAGECDGRRQEAAGGRISMIKSQLILRVAAQNPHLPNSAVEKVVNTIFDEMAAALVRRKRVELRGFGAIQFDDQTRASPSQSKNWGQNQRPRKAASYV
jgi:nucleoid DNA-binding protein